MPSLFIPHVHLDDAFYHFPDVHRAIADATRSLVAPSSAVDFYRRRGFVNVELLGAGVDLDEAFDAASLSAFRELYLDTQPFILVLGRKAQSKNYGAVIAAAARLTGRRAAKVVLIGPDDDGEIVAADGVTYLGAQPRAVVRGALMAASALATMSKSESFGMVVAEAWLAGTPVVANRDTAAFRDLVVDGVSGLLCDAANLAAALETAMFDDAVRARLIEGGKRAVLQHGWAAVAGRFVEHCVALVKAPPREPA